MKKVFLIFFYLFFAQSIFAFEFTKFTGNPVSISYINNYAHNLQVNIFKEGDVYKGIFVINRPPENYYSLGYFESVNGIDWLMKKEILNTGVELSNPSVTKIQTGYLLFITRYDNNTVYRIYSSICDFDFNCSSSFSPVITPDINNGSEKKGVFAGRPFVQDNRTYLFFGAWGDDGFKIKLAYSDDLINWQRCPNGFLYGGDGPFPYADGSDLHLFFHRSDSSGIKTAKTILPLTCDSIFEDQGYLLVRDQNYDQKHLIFPSVINDNGSLKLYYSGRDSNWNWNFDLACTGQACLSPTPTTTPTSIPTPTSTPTPTSIPEKTPIVIIPGFMASWNKDAILHNKAVDYSVWKLQKFVKEYDGLINTLRIIGYNQDTDFFLFPYDWRQPIDKTTDDLNSFLQEKIWKSNPHQKVNLIGHSLGGLAGRIFAQKNREKVNKIISVGSPHFGAVQFYKPLEAGEIDRENTFLWLAEKIILILNKSAIESDKTTIANKFPVAKDLFPTFNFLKDTSGSEVSIDSLSIKNNFLSSYNNTFSDIFPIFTAIYGEKDGNTPGGYTVEPQNITDQLLGNYPDGRPREMYLDFGDYTILSKSASQDTDSEKLYLDHGEIIFKKEAIKQILTRLNINFSDSQIIEGKSTKISPSLIFMIKSPATIKAEFGDDVYTEDEGLIYIPDAKSGNYSLKVQGIDKGKYEIIIGQISENNDIWESISGEITQSPASSQIDNYKILYNSQTALPIFPSPTTTPIPISTPTETPTPILVPTLTQISTNSLSSNQQSVQLKNDEIPISNESVSKILGIQSSQKELFNPATEAIKKTGIKKVTKKSALFDYLWTSIASLILGGTGWFFRKKIFRR